MEPANTEQEGLTFISKNAMNHGLAPERQSHFVCIGSSMSSAEDDPGSRLHFNLSLGLP
jgi:hypothetical protein